MTWDLLNAELPQPCHLYDELVRLFHKPQQRSREFFFYFNDFVESPVGSRCKLLEAVVRNYGDPVEEKPGFRIPELICCCFASASAVESCFFSR